MLGGDLKVHSKLQTRFPEDTAELSSAIAYLHSQRIIHRSACAIMNAAAATADSDVPFRRDIKPENILLDSLGHVHISDFGVATRFEDEKPLQGTAGTLVYMGTSPKP
jgi:serine/threonine kinase 32